MHGENPKLMDTTC